jgi:hypothetical protein
MPLSNRQLAAVIARRKASAHQSRPRRTRRSQKVAQVPATSPNVLPLIQSHGATEVTTFAHEVHVVHISRRADASEADVAANFDAMFGPGMFERIRPFGRFMLKDEGGSHDDPSDSYILILPKAAFGHPFVTEAF